MNIFKRSTIASLLLLPLVACSDSKEKKTNNLAQVQHTITTATITSSDSKREKIKYVAQVQHIITTAAIKNKNDGASAMSSAAKGDAGKKKAIAKFDLIIKDMQTTLEAINKLDVPKDGETIQKEVRELFENNIKAFKEDRDTLEKEGFARMIGNKIEKEGFAKSLSNAFTEFIKKAEITEEELLAAATDLAE